MSFLACQFIPHNHVCNLLLMTGIWLPFKIEKSVAILFLVKKKRILVSPGTRDKFHKLCVIVGDFGQKITN